MLLHTKAATRIFVKKGTVCIARVVRGGFPAHWSSVLPAVLREAAALSTTRAVHEQKWAGSTEDHAAMGFHLWAGGAKASIQYVRYAEEVLGLSHECCGRCVSWVRGTRRADTAEAMHVRLEAELDHKAVPTDGPPDRIEETPRRKLVASPAASSAANAFIKRHGGGRAVPRNRDNKITETMQIVRAVGAAS